MRQKKRRYTAAQKVSYVRRHLVEKVVLSDICDEVGIQPSQYYGWQKALFENGEAALADKRGQKARDRQVAELEAKLASKNEVISELLEELVALKKSHGVT
ncbi:transposase IS3/IS911 family protein [Magnetococcus marinus MC-1]|uniref:Transposase IS3/IS911 family protein n=1 Tax=Magnetococcus marinus (strain ATCC BAA-1437 / JCM 17883 / MC-1) TaxID=156889 RepID=A0L7D8_MAGMM|nr:transposase [Magnetococcus marinus]ABK43881.1 transposase IS3/IS911 family protein [Magnetococcus marinus MC-1]